MNIHSNAVVMKIHDGTPRSDLNLCPTCVNSHVYTGASGEKHVACHRNYQHPIQMREAVVACNGYFDRTKPSLHQMEEIAWTLMTDKGGRKLGFKAPDRRDGDVPGPPTIGF